MPEEKKKPGIAKHIRKWGWCAAIVIVMGLIVCCLLWKSGLWEFQTIDERLAAIEAARAIPDEENAAIIYNQLLENYDESPLSPDFLDNKTDNLTRVGPWLSKDFPEVAEWIEEQQDTISKLLEASKKEKCRFPIIIDPQQMNVQMKRVSAMKRWAYLLTRAANNDMAEGRIDAALEKYLCLIQMGRHLCQQSVMIDYLVGIAVEALALSRMKTFILQGDLTENHLKIIEAAVLPTKNNWSKDSAAILDVERLYKRKNVGFFSRVRYWRLWRLVSSNKDIFGRFQECYLRRLTDRCGNRILLALRRYKNKNGHWPESLDDVKSFAPVEIFVDPMNNSSFVYKLTEDSFALYSKGKNSIDENGRYRDDADDWLIWPPRGYKTKKENADAE